MTPKPTDIVPIKLRLRESLRRKIERAAKLRDHSANAEAVWRIERTFEQDDALAESIKRAEARQDELEKQWRQQAEKEISERAKYASSLRDTMILNMMVGGKNSSGFFLRLVAGELTGNLNWADTAENRKAFADRLREIIMKMDYLGHIE